MRCWRWKEFIMLCNLRNGILVGLLSISASSNARPNDFPESPGFPKLVEPGFFAGLKQGDNREIVLQKLQSRNFLGYRELQSDLIKSPIRWDGHAYELTCKFEGKSLSLCLIQGEAGGRIFFMMKSFVRNGRFCASG